MCLGSHLQVIVCRLSPWDWPFLIKWRHTLNHLIPGAGSLRQMSNVANFKINQNSWKGKKWKILAPQTWQWSTTRGILLAHTISSTSLKALPICSWDIEQILLFLKDKWSFSAWVNNSKLHFIRLLMPWAKPKQSEKCNGPYKTCCVLPYCASSANFLAADRHLSR